MCPDDTIEIFRDRVPVRELTMSRLGGRDIQTVEIRAFPHLARLAIAGDTATHVLRRLARSADPSVNVNADVDTGADSGQIQVLSPGIENLSFHFAAFRSRTKGLGLALSNGSGDSDRAVAEADLCERCAELERVLRHRAQRGARLVRLEFGCTDESGWMGTGSESSRLRMLDPAGPDWVSWRPIVEPLEKLVDRPVVFTGYRFFAS